MNLKPDDKQPENESGKVAKVTARNYADRARDFMTANQTSKSEFGVVIDPLNEPQQWGAWYSYFGDIKRRASRSAMKRIHREFVNFNIRQDKDDERKASLTYLVPAKFPSDFDADRDWYDDQRAGETFMNWFKAEKDKQASIAAIPPEDRARVVVSAMKGLNLKSNLDWRPGQ